MQEKAEPKGFFKQKHSVALRIWHWILFLTILGSLITVLFAKTLFNTKGNIPLVQGVLQKSNIAVTPDQARAVSHEFNDLLWHWHIYLGYFLAALFALRILIEVFNPKEQKLIPIIKRSMAALKMPDAEKSEVKHYLLVKYLYLFFYFSLLVQVSTGLFMAYSDDIAELKQIRHTASDVHSVFMWIIISYIVIHIGGVILAETNKKYKGVVSGMINGGE